MARLVVPDDILRLLLLCNWLGAHLCTHLLLVIESLDCSRCSWWLYACVASVRIVLRWVSSLASRGIALTWTVVIVFCRCLWLLVSCACRVQGVSRSNLLVIWLLTVLHNAQRAILLLILISLLGTMTWHSHNTLPGNIRVSHSFWYLVVGARRFGLRYQWLLVRPDLPVLFISSASFVMALLGVDTWHVLFRKSRNCALLVRRLLISNCSNVRVFHRWTATGVVDGVGNSSADSSSTSLSVRHIARGTCVAFICYSSRVNI